MFNFLTGALVLWQIETDAENDGWQESRTKTNGGAGRTSLTALFCLLLCCFAALLLCCCSAAISV